MNETVLIKKNETDTGVNVSTFGATFLGAYEGGPDVEADYQWTTNQLRPIKLRHTYTWANVSFELYITGSSWSDVDAKLSQLVAAMTECEVDVSTIAHNYVGHVESVDSQRKGEFLLSVKIDFKCQKLLPRTIKTGSSGVRIIRDGNCAVPIVLECIVQAGAGNSGTPSWRLGVTSNSVYTNWYLYNPDHQYGYVPQGKYTINGETGEVTREYEGTTYHIESWLHCETEEKTGSATFEFTAISSRLPYLQDDDVSAVFSPSSFQSFSVSYRGRLI